MALLVYFELIQETEEAVEYAFGTSPEELDRQLTIDKGDRRAKPADGLENHLFLGAAGKILTRQRTEGAWPAKGMRAS